MFVVIALITGFEADFLKNCDLLNSHLLAAQVCLDKRLFKLRKASSRLQDFAPSGDAHVDPEKAKSVSRFYSRSSMDYAAHRAT